MAGAVELEPPWHGCRSYACGPPTDRQLGVLSHRYRARPSRKRPRRMHSVLYSPIPTPQGVVVGVADAADRGCDGLQREALGEVDRGVLLSLARACLPSPASSRRCASRSATRAPRSASAGDWQAGERRLAAAEHDRRVAEHDLVDHGRLEALPDELAPPAMVTVSSPAASSARSIASSKLVTKWKVVPPSISTGSCG